MKIGVVGNQKGWSCGFVHSILSKHIKLQDTIISGGAVGVDTYAQTFAEKIGLSITIHYPRPYIERPDRYFERNLQIAKECDMLIAFDKKSGRAGTKNTISHATRLGKKILLFKNETGR